MNLVNARSADQANSFGWLTYRRKHKNYENNDNADDNDNKQDDNDDDDNNNHNHNSSISGVFRGEAIVPWPPFGQTNFFLTY